MSRLASLKGFISAKAVPILLTLLALSFIGSVVLGKMLRSAWGENGSLETALQFQKTQTVEAKYANDNLTVTIERLRASKQDLVDEMAREKDQAQQAILDRDKRIEIMGTAAVEERRKWNELINQKPQCEAFLRDSLGDYCSDLAIRVRERSRNSVLGLQGGIDP